MTAAPPENWAAASRALERLNADFCFHLDHGRIDELIDLFAPDAVYTHGTRKSLGRAEIRDVFTKRAASASPRVSRHVQSGLRLEPSPEGRARGYSVCVTFAGNGTVPLYPAVPILVADFHDEYQLGADGRWRFARRDIVRIFADSPASRPVGADGAAQ